MCFDCGHWYCMINVIQAGSIQGCAHNQFQLIKLSTASSFAQERRGCCKFFPGVWKRRYIDALNRHRWLWRRRKISSAAIITFPARKADVCAPPLCVNFRRKMFSERGVYFSAWRKILMRACLFAAVICLRRTDGRRRRLLFFIMHTWEIAAGALRAELWKQWCCFFRLVDVYDTHKRDAVWHHSRNTN
jgi:hypothetical protein